MLGDNPLPLGYDGIQRLIPANACELLAALGAGALHGIEQTIRVIVTLFVVIQLHAQTPARHRVVTVARHLEQLSIFYMKLHAASIRAVVWATAVMRRDIVRWCVHIEAPRLSDLLWFSATLMGILYRVV